MNDIPLFLSQFAPFDGLAEQQREKISRNSALREYRAKDIIFFEGDTSQLCYYVVSGRVSLRKTSANGKELIVALLFAGDPLGVLAVLDNRAFPLTAQAQSACSILEIPVAELNLLFSAAPELNKSLLDVIGQRLRASHELSRAMAHDRAEVRIAAALLMLTRFNELSNVKVSRQEVSDLSGVTLETAVRLIRAWGEDGTLDLSVAGQLGILRPERLRQLAELA